MKKQQYALKGPGRFHFLVPFLLSLIFLCPQVRAQEIKKDRKVTGVIVNSVT